MPTPIDDCLIHYDATGTVTTALKGLWRGCAGMLVLGGPSLKSLPTHLLAERGVASLAVNAVAARVPVKAVTWSDPSEKIPEAVLLDPGIMKLVPKRKLARNESRRKLPDGSFEFTGKHAKDYPNTFAFEDRGWWTPESFLTEPSASFGNNASGVARTNRPKLIFTMLSAIRLMHFLGCRRVYLLGCDFYMDPAQPQANYAFEDERDVETLRGVATGNNAMYAVANDMLTEARPYLEAAGFQVFNCNQWSRLRAFDHVPFDEALDDCRNGIPPGEVDTAGWYQKTKRR